MHTVGRRSAPAFTLVIAASVAAGCLVFVEIVLAHRPPSWDEAAHTLQGALIAHDLRAGDFLGLLFDTYRQVYWPPMHSWLIGIPFLVTGPDLVVARVVSVVAFVLLAPTLFLIARTVEPRHGNLAGCLAAALTLSCPGILTLAARSMLELPGLLAMSCTMLIYCRLDRDPDAPIFAHALLGLATVLTYLVKSNYGVLLLISIALTKLLAVRFQPRRLLTRQNLYAILPVALFCVLWFAYPPKIVSTWNSLVNQPWGGEEARGLAGLFFYPRAFVDFSGLMSILLWGGLILAWKYKDDFSMAFLAVLALTLFIIGEFHHTKLDRHIVPMLPPMFVLTGVVGARLWASLLTRDDRIVAITFLAAIAILHTATFVGRNLTQTEISSVNRGEADITDYLSIQIEEHSPTLILGTRGARPRTPVLDWQLVSSGLLPPTAAGEAMDPRQERKLARMIDRVRIPENLKAAARRVFKRYDAPTMTRSLDARREPQARFEAILRATLESDPPRAIIALVGTADTTSQTVDFLEPAIIAGGYRQVSVRDFPLAQTRVHVYRRP